MRLILSTLAAMAFAGTADAHRCPLRNLLFHRHHQQQWCPTQQAVQPCCPQNAFPNYPQPQSLPPAPPATTTTPPYVNGAVPVGGVFNHSRHGRLFDAVALEHAKRELVKRGVSPDDVERAIAKVGAGKAVDAAVRDAKVPVGAIGDGTLIQAIVDFFRSAQGQAIIAALVKILLAALGGL